MRGDRGLTEVARTYFSQRLTRVGGIFGQRPRHRDPNISIVRKRDDVADELGEANLKVLYLLDAVDAARLRMRLTPL